MALSVDVIRPSRRALLAGAGLAAFAAPGLAGPVLARAPLAGAQVPGLYRIKVGKLEVTAVLDGHLDLPTSAFPAAGAAAAEVDALLDHAALPRGPVHTPVNTYLVNNGERLVLVDTGTATAMGPALGQMPRNLAAAGIAPEQIDVVLMTHLHPDHAGGLLTDDRKAFFPNAEVVVAAAEQRFWADDAIMNQAPREAQQFFHMARAAVKPYADAGRLRQIGAGGEVLPGIDALAAPGHTPGHTTYRIASGSDQLLIWGDIVHVAPFQFARPDWSIAFDTDQALAAATRKRLFDMVATDRLAVAGMHLPFPGFGRVVKEGAGYRFQPLPWRAI